MSRYAIIIGAGPAGLTAAYEFVTKTEIIPIVLEKSGDIGGLSKTVVYKGNRIDIGGHRFFSKSDEVMNWWQEILPVQGASSSEINTGTNMVNNSYYTADGPDPEIVDRVMLVRKRLSRIFFLRKFFDYPISLSGKTVGKLGCRKFFKIGLTYLWIKILPPKKIESLEDFFISRFGLELYKIFFKDYTEKVWGVSCSKISAEWGKQRVKELSVSKALLHAIKTIIKKDYSIEQKNTETSLIDRFLYPKYGPGQMWENVARIVIEKGGHIYLNSEVTRIISTGDLVRSIFYLDHSTGNELEIIGDYFLSTMPIRDLLDAMGKAVPKTVAEVSRGLQYRDFITVGLLLSKLKIGEETNGSGTTTLVPDNWIYIQEREVQVGRLQIFNNWSPYLVPDRSKVWIGLEYFCNEGDKLWEMEDEDFIRFAVDELEKIDIIDKKEVLDYTIVRMPKTYPAYFGTYSRINVVREFTDHFQNLFLIGRNGMHRYNNQDHSMLTAMAAVNNIISGISSKDNIWEINTEEKYHEENANRG